MADCALLARDVEVLRKMLVTRSPTEWVQQELVKPARAVAAWPGVRPPVTRRWEAYRGPPRSDQRPSVEEEMLDLVRMHYMETDDPVTRLWLGMMDPPRQSGYQTVPKMTAKYNSHKDLVKQRMAWQARNMAEDYKRWYPEESAHLKALQSQTHAATERRLCDGGAFLPPFHRKVMQSKATRAKYMHNMMEVKNQSYFTDEHDGHEIQAEVYPWPEGDAPRRVLHAPSVYSWRQKQRFFRGEVPSVDFASGRTGRGLDRDGIWSTGRWHGDDVPRGRTTRRARRRAASEPPPGAFTAARLPISFNSTRELLIFPKMTLSTMDRRARRRSLSRTRIAEMFNWEIILDDSLGKPIVQPHMMEMIASAPKVSARRHSYPDAIQHPTPSSQKQSALWEELGQKFGYTHLSVYAVYSAWAAMHDTDRGAFTAPPWMASVDGDGLVEFMEKSSPNGNMQLNPYRHYIHPTWVTPPCMNCASTTHDTRHCPLPCGYCGAPNPNVDYKHVDVARNRHQFPSDEEDDDNGPKAGKHDNPHLASSCPVARHNRCKCTPFPQFHTAAKCLVLCSRPCGNTAHPPGHFKHRNAMGCKSRCCICGMRGHSGTMCKLMTCRCGGKHLGQDCAWQPACRVVGCGRFHCGIHCRACGMDRHTAGPAGVDVMLVGGLCLACVDEGGSSEALDAKGEGKGKGKGKGSRQGRKRRDYRKDGKKEEANKSWYTPLAPRTRPVVGIKSGKSAAKRDRVDGEAEVKIGGCR